MCKKMSLNSYLTPRGKPVLNVLQNYNQWTTEINIITETIKLLEDNIEENCALG